ncbi:glycoside hydrolase family 13 protein [Longirhabdus pacifica]|uniref:glycoside hydrolase family 13 protein n=1 Tax=Longirhabdus pacifica TaxID=2305227 RepID=UPI001008C881|nr:alpha-glucosidase [Longirhabdus pacifica]
MLRRWWHDAVVYQIYPRSFYDDNNDGIGDIPGIISKLDYLKELGVSIIWLSPVYQSPMDDNGYDISDYKAIAEEFGTMEDMEQLIAAAKQKGISIMMDLVVNHTSDEHSWFVEALQSPDNKYRDYYIWRDPATNGGVPNDLQSIFSGSAWEFDEKSGQYYLHLFSKKQPDLNWDNEQLRHDIYNMMNWWLDKGIKGFRMDVIDLIGKDIDKGITGNGPSLHPRLKEMNQHSFGSRDTITVGETWGATPDIALQYSGESREELSMVFQFEHVTAFHDEQFGKWKSKPVDFNVLKDIFTKWQLALNDDGWNSLFWNNHDLPRVVSKYGDDKEYRTESAKMLATMIHFMKGTPYIFQGEEIGMTNVKFPQFSDYNDIEIHNAYQDLVDSNKLDHESMMEGIYADGRDNARTPMQWDDSLHAGFTTGTPWLKVNPNYDNINVEQALDDKDSIFYYYKHLVQLRKEMPVMVYGKFKRIIEQEQAVFAYQRTHENDTLTVILNHTNQVQHVKIPEEVITECGKVIAHNYKGDNHIQHHELVLQPYESIVYVNATV